MAALQFLIALARPNPNEPDWRRKTVIGTLCFVGVWLVVALFCVVFQCEVPHTWNEASGRCFDQLAFWIANGSVDVVTQLLVGLTPIYLLMNLQLSAANKRLAMAAFAPNITTIPLAILRVYYLNKSYHSPDTTLTSFTPTLITVIHTNYSIIASCMPFLKPIFDSLAIGLMTNAINVPIERVDESSGSRSRNKDSINPFALLGGKGYKTRNAYGWTRFPKDSEYTSEIVGERNKSLSWGIWNGMGREIGWLLIRLGLRLLRRSLGYRRLWRG
ncbi:hypothetical protein ABVK25_001780 [Lepraria finkii]|uniref:Rhodopsin domain-containing protein n=1 Tax=Lepraria finkii TaxID=1340010 RepID=A0ABR4BK18_9LECA